MARKRNATTTIEITSSTVLVGVTVLLLLTLAVGGVFVSQRSEAIPTPPPGVANVTPEGFAVKGAPTAPVTIVEYGDFQCANCRRFTEESLPAFETYIQSGLVRLVYHDFPVRGEESLLAAEAARCALEQNAFWPYHDLLYQKQAGVNDGTFSRENLKLYAASLGLDTQAFNRCLDSGRYRPAVEKALDEAKALGLRGTPSFVIQDPAAVRDPIAGDPGAVRWEDLFQRYINDFGLQAPEGG